MAETNRRALSIVLLASDCLRIGRGLYQHAKSAAGLGAPELPVILKEGHFGLRIRMTSYLLQV
jgi:hypothetical protein